MTDENPTVTDAADAQTGDADAQTGDANAQTGDAGESDPRMTRRRVVAGGVALGATALAGCAGDDPGSDPSDGGTEPATEPDADGTEAPDGTEEADGGGGGAPALPSVEDPPDAVYVPTHFEAMRHLDPIEAGEYEVVPMVTYPHQFWNVTGTETSSAQPTGEEDVHLMATIRDPETGAILPAETGLRLTIGRADEDGPGTPTAPWPMISQEMGFHLGDNVPLGEDGTYEIEVRVGPIDARKTGAFEGRFEEGGTGTFTFEFDQAFRNAVVGDITYVDEGRWGERGALANSMQGGMHGGTDGDDGMDGDETDGDDGETDGGSDDGGMHGDDAHHGHDGDEGTTHGDGGHVHDREHDHRGEDRWEETVDGRRLGAYWREPGEGELPPAEHLPGSLQGVPPVDDALLATTLLDRGSRFVDGDEYYLAVSPRTPYNRSMLPMTALGYELRRDGEVVSEGALDDALDPEVGHHYATELDDVADGDALVVRVETVPNVSRHAGYETAFLEPGAVELEVTLP